MTALTRPGISETTLRSAEIRFSDYPEKGSIEIPYWTPEGEMTHFKRYRLPSVRANGQKYHQEPGSGVYAYFPPRFFRRRVEPPFGLATASVVLIEGEFKALSLLELGVYTIGLPSFFVYIKDDDGRRRFLSDLQKAFSKEIKTIYFIGDADTCTNFEFSRSAAFLARNAYQAQVLLPRIPFGGPKGIDDCKAETGAEFASFFAGLIKDAITLDRKCDETSLAFVLLEREQERIKALKGMEFERQSKRVVKMVGAAQSVGETDATARLHKLGAKVIGISEDALRRAIKTEQAKSKAHSDVEKGQQSALFQQLFTEFGPPAYRDAKDRLSRINERFFAELIARENEIVHDADDQKFYLYNPENGRWERRSVHAIKNQLSNRIRQAEREWEAYNGISQLDTEPNRRDIISLLRGVVEKTDYFVNRPHAIHAANCMLVFEDGDVVRKPFGPEFRSRNQLTVAYDPDAKWDRFEKELLRPALDDDDFITIQKMFGLLVLGRNRPQRIFILTGPGNTGKTTVCLIAQGLVGQNNCAELRTNQLEGRFEMARLLNKTLIFGADVAANFLMTESAYRLKSIVGGDPMVGERKNSNEDFRFKGDINAIITANVRLLIKLHGDFDKSAWFRRLCLINFCREPLKKRIANFDQVLLKEEGSGILNFAIQGLRAYYKDQESKGDICLSEAQVQRIEKLLSESDGLRRYITEELVEDGGDGVTSNEIVIGYAKYAKAKKWMIQSRRTIESMTQDLVLEVWGIGQDNHVKRGDKKVRGYPGLRMRATTELDPDE
jgi:putative DNA primase/helicase